jgi:hypothetical protein
MVRYLPQVEASYKARIRLVAGFFYEICMLKPAIYANFSILPDQNNSINL